MSVGILCDVAAERAILAAICTYHNNAFLEVADIVNAESFTVDSNTLIYKCFTHIFDEDSDSRIDISNIYSAAKTIGISHILEKPDEVKHLNAITHFPVDVKNIRKFAIKLRKLQLARDYRKTLEFAKDNLLEVTGAESVSEILAIGEQAVFSFATSLDKESDNPDKISDDIVDFVQNKIDNPVDQLGLSTSFPTYDAVIGGGLRRGAVAVFGGRTKSGKSIIGNIIANHVAGTLNIPVLNLDTEMKKEDHMVRTLAAQTRILINDIEKGSFSSDPEKVKSIKQAAQKIHTNYPYAHKSIADKSFQDQLGIMRRWLMKEVGFRDDGTANDCLIIYDYLKLMDSNDLNSNLQEYQLLGFMMTGLHNFAVKYDVPILAFVQLNRDGINKEDTSTISQSDRIAHLCSNLCIFKNKSPEEIAQDGAECGNTKIVPMIARHGAGGAYGQYINCKMEGEYAIIKELGTTKDIAKKKKSIRLDEEIDFGKGTNG